MDKNGIVEVFLFLIRGGWWATHLLHPSTPTPPPEVLKHLSLPLELHGAINKW